MPPAVGAGNEHVLTPCTVCGIKIKNGLICTPGAREADFREFQETITTTLVSRKLDHGHLMGEMSMI